LRGLGRFIIAGIVAGLLSGCAGTIAPTLHNLLPQRDAPQAMALVEVREAAAAADEGDDDSAA